VHSPSLQSPHIGYATLWQNALDIHDDTVSNGFSREGILWLRLLWHYRSYINTNMLVVASRRLLTVLRLTFEHSIYVLD